MADKLFRPMLAAKADLKQLQYPLYASAKLDGIRAMVKGGKLLSRRLKPIPNRYVQALFGRPELEGMDGELIAGSPTAKDAYRATNSAVMSQDGEPDVTLWVFDRHDTPDVGFGRRMTLTTPWENTERVSLLTQWLVGNEDTLLHLEQKVLDEGYEGLILRKPEGPYKYGRSTIREGWLLKLKRFEDAEALVIGFEELMHNDNEPVTNALGQTERSTHQENQIPMNTLGALIVQDTESRIEFKLGSGFTASEREEIWQNREGYSGVIVKYKHFPIGRKVKPRSPTYLGVRDQRDL